VAKILPVEWYHDRPMGEDDRLRQSYEDRVRTLNQEIRHRERELVILAQVAGRVHGVDDVQGILDIALEEILDRMDLKAAWIFAGDERDRKLHLAASRGVSPAYLEEVRTQGLGECLCPEVFWSGHRMQARNTTQCPRMPDIVSGLTAPVAHACIPLKFEGATKGVLNVAARPGEQFSDDELRFLETLGHQIGLAVERARHRESERRRNREAQALAAINRAIGGSLDPEAILHAVGETAREILAADRVAIFLGSDPRKLRVAHLGGLPHPALVEGQLLDLAALRARLHLRALEKRRVFSIDDWEEDPRVNAELARRWEAASGVIAPLAAHDRGFGLIVITSATPRGWTPEQVAVAEALAAQAAIALDNARLYDDARKAYDELKDAQERILRTEKMAVLGTFASGLAHEVRNPLNSIGLQLSILERRIGRVEAGLGREMTDLVGIIHEEVHRLDRLVGDFLLFSRTDRLYYRPADLGALTDEVVQLLEPEAKTLGVTMRRAAVGEPVPMLQMDAEKVKQVVINLVRNAFEAMPTGGLVSIESGVVDGQARLVVRDTGPGLPEGVDVFQLFVTTKPKGTGLGLSIVQQIVLQHGGEIVVHSEPGKGAAFTVCLPVPGAKEPKGEVRA
jgi:signal transduction histidine kinase